MTTTITTQFDRQERLFGHEGQERIHKTRVAIVGLGGTGSHLAQQLAYLGVREFTLIDKDRVEASNLNRLIGASPSSIGRLKIDVAADLIKGISPTSKVCLMDCDIRELNDNQPFNTVDYVFGCVDNDAARLAILTECSKVRLPFIDLATDMNPSDDAPGGRVFFSKDGKGCLMCTGLLDQEEIRVFSESREDKEFRQKVYGVSTDHLKETGPAVVFINGMIASIAVTEFTMAVTKLAEPIIFTEIKRRNRFGNWTTKHIVNLKEDCYYCGTFYGNGK